MVTLQHQVSICQRSCATENRRGSDCGKIERLLSDYLLRNISPDNEQAVEVHVVSCEACFQLLQQTRDAIDALALQQ
jgi:anti-sigma factor RsiW